MIARAQVNQKLTAAGATHARAQCARAITEGLASKAHPVSKAELITQC